MKQDAFIQTLRHELGSLPKSAVDEIVADYREYIGDAIAAGRSEEEVIAALGDPVKLARELRAQANYREWESHRSFGNLMRVIVSIAGLGLINMLLLIPFMIYLALLTAGYAMSIGFAIAGLAAVLTLGSHRVFGWPSTDTLPFNVSILSQKDGGESAADAKEAADDAKEAAADAKEAAADVKDAAADKDDSDAKAASDAKEASGVSGSIASAAAAEPKLLANLKHMKIVGDNFVFTMTDDARLALMTTQGPVTIHRNSDGGYKIASPNAAAQNLLTMGKDGTITVPGKSIVALSLHDDDSRVSLAHDPSSPRRMVWDIKSDDGHVSFVQDENGNPTHVAIRSGSDSVLINSHELRIDDDHDHLRFSVPPGSTFAGLALAYGFISLLGGIVGLLLCVWLTRMTWRGIVRYAKQQIDLISARLDGGPA